MDLGMILAASGLVFAGVVKGTVGFGLPMIAAPVLAGYVGPRTAVVVMSAVNTLSGLLVTWRSGSVPLRPYLRVVVPTSISTLICTVIGANLLVRLDPRVLTALVGLVAVGFSLLAITRLQPRIPHRHQQLIGVLVGVAAGLLGATTSVSATPLVIYFQALGLPKRDFVTVLNLLLVALSLVQIVSFASLGLYNMQVVELSGLTMLCVALGVGLGLLVQDRVNQKLFNRLVVAVIFAVGTNLIWRAIAG